MLKQKMRAVCSWISKSFSRKIMLTMFLCMSLIILFSSVIYYYSTTRLLQNEYIRSNEQLLNEVNQSINRYYTQLDEVTRSLYSDNTFIDNLRRHRSDYVSVDYNERAVKNILHSDDAIQYIYFYDPYTRNLYSFSRENVSYAPCPRLEQEDWYQKTVQNKNYFYMAPLHTFTNYNHFGTVKEETVFSVNRALRYYATGEVIGILSISYDTSYLEKISVNLRNSGGYISILNQDMSPMLSDYPGLSIPETAKTQIQHTDSIQGHFIYRADGIQRILLWDKLEDTYLLKDIPLEELTKNALIVSRLTVIFLVVVLVLSVAAAMYFSRSATRRLSMLSKNISAFGNDNLEICTEDYGSDEIGMTAGSFRDMTNRINTLINLEYKAKVMQKTAELQALQAQIKPHFINNALQALGTLGLKKGVTEVYSMAGALAQMLRYTLKPAAQLVPLKQEIENMNNYLYIQRILWNDRLKVEVDTDKSLEERLVPVFILQPLVENSIKHGLDDCTDGLITIRIHMAAEGLSIEIADNGRGIPPCSLDMLKEWLREDTNSPENEHIGIRNIVGRMKLLYGENAEFSIDCPAEGGTRICIVLPDEPDSLNSGYKR